MKVFEDQDAPEVEPDWETVDVSSCFDAPNLENIGETEKDKLNILREMTKRIMTSMQKRMKAMLSGQQNLNEKDVARIIETVERLEMDKSKITVRFGGEAIKLAKEMEIENMINIEEAKKDGLVIMQLPKPLAKYWNRGDGGAKKVNWGRIYGQLYDEFWQGVEYAKDNGLYLKQQNKPGIHDPKKYYYVFVPSFENIENVDDGE